LVDCCCNGGRVAADIFFTSLGPHSTETMMWDDLSKKILK
jgi:hypothetical protein